MGVFSQSKNVSDDTEEMPKHPRQFDVYWFGYLYAAFWGFCTYSCATHVLATLITFQGWPETAYEQGKIITAMALWPIMTVLFGWVTYRLLRGKVSMIMIYVLVVVHTLNMIGEGIIP